MRASGETDGHGPGEAVDVFTALAILVVEGRTPGGGRGFHAGPHCPLPQHPISRHICQPNSNVCVRAEALVRQLRLMWGVGVGASVEVLIAPDCHHGASLAHTLDTATAPSNNLTLLEQWTFTIFDRRLPDASASGWSLLAAVRSFLHFSQLSAWLSKSGGCNPPNVLYRVTVPSPVFCSKFVAEAEEHVFPIAYVGQDTSFKVTVRTLPRSEIVPLPICTEEHEEKYRAKAVYTHNTSVIVAPGPSSSKQDYGVNHKVEEDLRRSIVKARLAESNRISRSESPDTQLGESLLDPPNSLTRLSRRYQSPSRSGSPSLETPEHLICRPRSHTPVSSVRPPDTYTSSVSVTSRHPFAWTQSKFPIMPIPIHPSCTEPPPLPVTQTSGFHGESVPLHPMGDGGGAYGMSYCAAYQQHGRAAPLYTSRTVWPQTLDPQSHFQVHPPLPSPGYCNVNQPVTENFSSSPAGSSNHNPVVLNTQLTGPDFRKADGFEDPSHLPCKYRTSYCDVNNPKGNKEQLPTPTNKETDPCSSSGSSNVQMGEDYQSSTCTGTRLKQSRMHLEDKCVVDDLQWPCLQQGKHLCSSLEDLSDTCNKEGHSNLQLPMSEGDGKKCKTNFELTPRETLEVLSVLRQTTPLPPLRLDNHRNLADAQPETKISCQDLSSPCTSKMEVVENNFHGANLLSMDSSPIESKNCMPASGSAINSLPSVFHSQDNKWCHSRDSGNAHKLRTSPTQYSLCPENRFLEAIARSAEKNCDISDKKSFKCERPFRTEEGFRRSQSCPSDYSVKSHSEISDNYMLSPCVEAKKLRMKTNFYTASSEPAKGSREFQRQTSKTLGKSPISAILSNLQKVYKEGNEESEENFEFRKESVCRALKFDDDFESPVRQNASAQNGSSRVENGERGKANGEGLKVHKSVGTSSEIKEDFRAARENHGGFVKSASLLKHLMRSTSFIPSQGFSQNLKQSDDKSVSSSRSENCENGWKDHEEVKDAVEDGSSTNKEDAEVKNLLSGKNIPSASEKAQFRRSLDSATTLVFHSKTGLPLTSSPAPLRKGTRFDYDSSINSPSAIKRSTSFHCSALCNCDSEEEDNVILDARNGNRSQRCDAKRVHPLSTSAPATVTCSNLLGSFEECVLNGRLEPVSTVQGFTAEIAASGAFCPKHLTLPVTVFFYTLCDNDQISSPYLGHINLGKKGYHVPNKGTVQVTLFNPHRTVVKMFVVMYDLSDMPANSRTFLRQRTLNMPVGVQGDDHPDAHQWLRYLIHLRFASSKSGKIYLHTDVRMLIFRKSDADAATLHKTNTPYELRSFTHGPVNPKFSPRK